MSKTIRNYCLDVALFLLLGINIASLVLTHNDPSAGISPAHIASGALLVLLSLVHICMHWRWFRAVLSGKAKGKIKVMMDSLDHPAIIGRAIRTPGSPFDGCQPTSQPERLACLAWPADPQCQTPELDGCHDQETVRRIEPVTSKCRCRELSKHGR